MVTWISTVEAENVVMTVHATLTVSENQPGQPPLPQWLTYYVPVNSATFPFSWHFTSTFLSVLFSGDQEMKVLRQMWFP